jgi:hypothetical protein
MVATPAKMKTEPNTPTADAIRLAVKLSGHMTCQKAAELWTPQMRMFVCELCLGDAATIDRELLLPEKHAALLLAQGVVDEYGKRYPVFGHAFDELRESLKAIKTQ